MLIAEFQQYLFGFSIFFTSLFLVMLVLVQRGRGGGLTGALGGAGGQSAFGTKAGDLFTKITVGVAALWIFLCAAAVFFLKDRALPQTGVSDRNIPSAAGTKDPGQTPPADPNINASSGVTDVPPTPASESSTTTTPTNDTQPEATSGGETPQAEITNVPGELNLDPPTDSPAEPAATDEAPKQN